MPRPHPEDPSPRADLNRARAALAHMQRVARLGTWERDEVTGVVDWSAGLKQLLRHDPGPDPRLAEWLDRVHPDDRPRVDEIMPERVRGGRRVRVRLPGHRGGRGAAPPCTRRDPPRRGWAAGPDHRHRAGRHGL